MQKLILALALVGATVFVADAVEARQKDKHTVVFGTVTISWLSMAGSKSHAKAFPQRKGEALYMFVAVPKGGKQPSLDRFIGLAEKAVAAEGRCVWLGYDEAYDMQVRTYGALASPNDQRLFFTKLRCVR